MYLKEAEWRGKEYVIVRSEIVEEITTVIREWGEIFKEFFQTTDKNFLIIRKKLLELIRLRSQLLSGNLPADDIKEVTLLATSEIDTGNKLLGKYILIIFTKYKISQLSVLGFTVYYGHH